MLNSYDEMSDLNIFLSVMLSGGTILLLHYEAVLLLCIYFNEDGD